MGADAFFNNPIVQSTAIGLLLVGMGIVIRALFKLYTTAQDRIYEMSEVTIRQNVELEQTLDVLLKGIEGYQKDLGSVSEKLAKLVNITELALKEFTGVISAQKDILDSMKHSMDWQRTQNIEVAASVEAIREGLQTQALLKEFLLYHKE